MSDNIISGLVASSEDAEQVQTSLLRSILSANADTEYGKKYSFSDISSIDGYQERVPLSDWETYKEPVSRMMKGEEGILTSEAPVYYCISSGMSDVPRYTPLTTEDILIQKKYWIDGIEESVASYFSSMSSKYSKGRIFYIGEFFRTFTENGVMSGVRIGAPYRLLEDSGELDLECFTSPKEVLFSEKLEDLLYIKVLFALKDRSVTSIQGIFVHKIVGLFDHLRKNWDHYVNDIATGTVSSHFKLSDEMRAYLEKNLKPDIARANELKRILPGDGKGLALKIWPGLQYVCTAGGSCFSGYMEALKKYIGLTPVHYFVYATSESSIGISLDMNGKDAYYTLIPEAAVFEFMPVDDPQKRPVMAWETERDKEYELYVTTRSGLYRYSVGDIVRVTDHCGKMPVVTFSYRKSQVIDLADENMTSRQIENAVTSLGEAMGTTIKEYCIDTEPFEGDGAKPYYTVYIETGMGRSINDAKCSELVDGFFGKENTGYGKAREAARLSGARVITLEKGSFRSYGASLSEKGYRMEHIRPLRIIINEAQRAFFRDHIK
ncbi:MAG: GH3 auxin-responsive promoter family protein [Lachnospiraceae bacterium]|nr:GH3 auxin-responsive promoter family protein [Lachnospiraceae bacterium]